MKFPKSETIGAVTGSDGKEYALDFYGENEGAAVISGPIRVGGGKMQPVPEVHREPATDAADARRKLDAWCKTMGWR